MRRFLSMSSVLALAASLLLSLSTATPASADVPPVGDNTILAIGGIPHLGSTAGIVVTEAPITMASTPTGAGYWLAGSDGGVFSYGDAGFHGSTGAIALNKPIITMAATPTGQGYWLVATDGGVFAFGDAGFHGSTGDIDLNEPIVAMAATPSGQGYWLMGSDGGVFAFGDAGFHGSTGHITLNEPITGMARTKTGQGYWMVASDGGIFAFGDAPFLGTPPLGTKNVSAMAADPDGSGYRVVAADGGVFTFDAPFAGSAVGFLPSGREVVAIANHPAGYWLLLARPEDRPLGPMAGGVRGMQQRLYDLGYWGPVDGNESGFLTIQQVYAFQKVMGLPRDGYLDAGERRILERATRPRPRSTSGYVTEIDKTHQVIIVGENGRTKWVFNTSTGNGARYGAGAVAFTPEGHFRFERAIDGNRTSSLGTLYRPRYFVGGYAIHGSPNPAPYPASHGCARVSNGAINFIWAQNLMPIGSAVWSYR